MIVSLTREERGTKSAMRVLTIVLLLALGCGTGGGAGAGSAPAGRGPTSGPHGDAHEVGPKVSLVLGDKQVDIGLDEVPHDGTTASLRDVWRAGMPTDDPMLLHFDLYDLHGFHIGTRAACTRLLNGSDFAAARIDVRTHDVTYDDQLSINDCYRMRAIVRIVGMR